MAYAFFPAFVYDRGRKVHTINLKLSHFYVLTLSAYRYLNWLFLITCFNATNVILAFIDKFWSQENF